MKEKSKPPLRRGMIHDAIDPQLFNKINIIMSCEQCSYFDCEQIRCTLGHDHKKHLHSVQMKNYELTGRVALCRNLEID